MHRYGNPTYMTESETPHAKEVQGQEGTSRYVRHPELRMW